MQHSDGTTDYSGGTADHWDVKSHHCDTKCSMAMVLYSLLMAKWSTVQIQVCERIMKDCDVIISIGMAQGSTAMAREHCYAKIGHCDNKQAKVFSKFSSVAL